MDKNGFYQPGTKCNRCGAVLNVDGGHPAELYAGTYTGLCDRCTRAGPYVIKTYLDGAQLIDVAPSSPAHRRDREKYFAYSDCDVCGGEGHRRIVRADARGGSYNHQCPVCAERFYGHPERERYHKTRMRLEDAYQALYVISLKKARLFSAAKRGDKADKIKPIQARVQACYDRMCVWHEARSAHLF